MSDGLLEWMSFRGEGRLDALPALHLPGPPRRVLGDLAALGHIELPTAQSWRIAPPVLACLAPHHDLEPASILCGARTPGVVERLERSCHATGAHMSSSAASGRPAVIRVSAASNAVLAETAAQAGLRLQPDAAYALLSCVPAMHSWPRQACRMVGGRVGIVRRFSGSRAEWIASTLNNAATAPRGLFRIQRDRDWVSILKTSVSDCAYIDDRVGRMLVAAKRQHLSWNQTSWAFSLPVSLFPPLLVARALVLCTGRLPASDRASGRISFAGVNPAMLRLVVAITGLRLA
jgi:hypothetical protein